jgi:GNAT superfamily N-acetyltransferase
MAYNRVGPYDPSASRTGPAVTADTPAIGFPPAGVSLYDQAPTGQSNGPVTGNAMAHISPPSIGSPLDDGTRFRRPEPAEHRTALAVLLTGRPSPADPAVDQFLDFVRQQGLGLEELWAAYTDQTPVCATLIIPGAGRTAVLFVSPVTGSPRVRLTGDLVRTAMANLDPVDVCLIQSLLDPTQHREEQALTRAGFERLASLVYMRRSCLGDLPGPGVDPDASIECDGSVLNVYPWRDDLHDLFGGAIEASYLETLDCPALVGVRRIDDIIAGHKAVGRFDPSLWSAFYCNDQPAGVLLLNPLVDRRELELVYLGLTPGFRGRGLALRLMQRAMMMARRRGDAGIHLAVDQANTPAVRLYQQLGFRATGRKLAMIGVLK